LAERILADVQHDEPTLTLPWEDNGEIPFWRLDDQEFEILRQRSLAINEDYFFLMRLHSNRPEIERLSLGRARAALTKLSGPSSKLLDPYKQSFGFPFLYSVPPGKPFAQYLMIVQDIRGSLYFTSRRMVSADDPRIQQHFLHEPFAEEFHRKELNRLTATMMGFLKGFSECVVPSPFVGKVDSEQILYGYADGQYFEEQHDSTETYRAVFDRWSGIVAASADVDPPIIVTQ